MNGGSGRSTRRGLDDGKARQIGSTRPLAGAGCGAGRGAQGVLTGEARPPVPGCPDIMLSASFERNMI